MAVDPSGRFLFIALRATPYLVIADRNPDTGGVTITPASYVALGAGCRPALVATDPTGRFTYVACVNGLMVVLRTEPLARPKLDHMLQISPDAMAAEPYAKYFYTLDRGNAFLFSYLVELSGTSLDRSSVRGAGPAPVAIAVDPLGRFVYTANRGDRTLSLFLVRDDGLDVGATIALPAGATPVAARVDPSGQWLYVLQDPGPTIARFIIDQQTGALTAPSASATPTVPTPGGPGGVGGDLILTTLML